MPARSRLRILRISILAIACGCLLAASCGGGGRGGGAPGAPVISALVPNQGPRAGGNVVRIEGSGFGTKPFVTFGASNVTHLVSVSDHAIELVAPADQPGIASVSVATSNGAITTALDAYYYTPLPAKAWGGRFFANAPDISSANRVLVQSTNDHLTGIDVEVPPADAGAIAGLLLDADGAPLVGHLAVASRIDGLYPPVAFPAGVDGRYVIDGLPAGAWRVSTREDAGSELVDQAFDGALDTSVATEVDVVGGETLDGVDLTLARGGRITGVVSGGGAPLAGVTVAAIDDAGRSLQLAYAGTDADGRYVIDGLAEGSYRLVAFALLAGKPNTWWPDAYDPEVATPVAISGTAEATADFDLPPAATIHGTITENSANAGPLPSVLVIAHDVDRAIDFTGASGADGTYVIGGLPDGRFRLEAPELGEFYAGVTTTAAATLVVVTAGGTAPAANWLGTLDPAPPCGDPTGTGTLTGRVAGPGDASILRADVLAVGPASAAATTGLAGNWTIDCLAPGDYTIFVSAPGSDLVARTLGPFTVTAMSSQAADVALSHGASVEGRVHDAATHAPVAGATVRVRSDASGLLGTGFTDADGHWKVDRFSNGGIGLGAVTVEVRPGLVTDAN